MSHHTRKTGGAVHHGSRHWANKGRIFSAKGKPKPDPEPVVAQTTQLETNSPEGTANE